MRSYSSLLQQGGIGRIRWQKIFANESLDNLGRVPIWNLVAFENHKSVVVHVAVNVPVGKADGKIGLSEGDYGGGERITIDRKNILAYEVV